MRNFWDYIQRKMDTYKARRAMDEGEAIMIGNYITVDDGWYKVTNSQGDTVIYKITNSKLRVGMSIWTVGQLLARGHALEPVVVTPKSAAGDDPP